MRSPIKLLLFSAMALAALPQSPRPGVARWRIKTSVPPNANLNRPRMVPLAELLALPSPPDVLANDRRYQDARIPLGPGARYAEGDIVSTTGWVRLVTAESDGDYHIQITTGSDTRDDSLVVAVPKPETVFVSDVTILAKAAVVREFVKTRLLNGREPSAKTVVQHPVAVTVTGQLFFDDEWVNSIARGVFRGKSIAGLGQLPSKTAWEIHPVTAIAFEGQNRAAIAFASRPD